MSGETSGSTPAFALGGRLLAVGLVAGSVLGGYFATQRQEIGPISGGGDHALTPFRLVDQLNRTVTEADLRGQVLVVSFVFTSCSLSCLQVSGHMSEIQRAFEGADDVRLVSITVDPREDKPEVLSGFSRKFGADPRRWIFLTGESTNVHGLLRKSFLSVDRTGAYNPMPGGYTDADRIALVRRDGRVAGYVVGTSPDCAGKVVRAVHALRSAGGGR